MKKQEKIAKYMAQGLTKEQAERLITYGQNQYLTLQELSIKYDNPNLLTGKYPDWITGEKLYSVCQKVASQKYDTNKFQFSQLTKEDLEIELFIWATIRIYKFKNEQALKFGLSNRIKNILRQATKKEVEGIKKEQATEEQIKACEKFDRINGNPYLVGSLNNTLTNQSSDVSTFEDVIGTMDKEQEKLYILDTIRTIKNKGIKRIVIIAGYLLADLDELEQDFRNIIQTCSDTEKENLQHLCEQQLQYEDYIWNRTNSQQDKRKKKLYKPVSLIDIIEAFDIQHQLDTIDAYTYNTHDIQVTYKSKKAKHNLALDILENLKYYLVNSNILGTINLIE